MDEKVPSPEVSCSGFASVSSVNFSGPRVIVAMDFSELAPALSLAKTLDPSLCRLKVGNELFTAVGPAVLDAFHQLGFDIFLDLKYHDIPNTVAKAVAVAARHGVWMVNVHAGGGLKMMTAARDVLAGFTTPPLLIGVTLLTSFAAEDMRALGLSSTPLAYVEKLARDAWCSGLDGLVCSANEAEMLKKVLMMVPHGVEGKTHVSPILVTPGIRPKESPPDDQSRIMTPGEALNKGSTYLVIGRPITQASDPIHILRKINDETMVYNGA